MISPEQIPDEVVKAARWAFVNGIGPTSLDDHRAALAAALNAWEGAAVEQGLMAGPYTIPSLILPLQEPRDV